MTSMPKMPSAQRGHVARGDARIYFHAVGDGPAIVFAHGLGGSHLSWWQQVAHFMPRHRCIAISHRGFGPSVAPPGGPEPLEYADDLAAVLDHLGVAQAAIVGQSMGGWTTIEFALRYPARVRGIVLSSTSGTIDPRTLGKELHAPLDRWTAESATQRERCAANGVHVAAGPRMAREQPALHLLYQQIDETSVGLDKNRIRERLWATRVRDAAVARDILAPALVVMGAEDIVIPPMIADRLAASFARGRALTFPDAGHSPYFERAARFNDAVATFLATL
ncbi:MAG: alpha/beta hydrolase [Alphaproteobacteria bacterium]|nr:alpha/beta hydrolase [Alphaproteobacteria bacterium]